MRRGVSRRRFGRVSADTKFPFGLLKQMAMAQLATRVYEPAKLGCACMCSKDLRGGHPDLGTEILAWPTKTLPRHPRGPLAQPNTYCTSDIPQRHSEVIATPPRFWGCVGRSPESRAGPRGPYRRTLRAPPITSGGSSLALTGLLVPAEIPPR
jgi:hypothetical protein